MKTVKVKNLIIGKGQPKIVAPMVGETAADLLIEAEELASSACDLVEWRVDFFKQASDVEAVAKLSREISVILQEKPLLFTFRTKKEGGVRDFSTADYFRLYATVIAKGQIDLLDVELFMPEKEVHEIMQLAHQKEIIIVMCNHDFNATPSQQEIVSRLCTMQEKHADICKIAVMPHNTTDLLTLLAAANEMQKSFRTRPIVAISMGELGMISRISGEIFGSALTFGTIKKASAPGQIPVSDLKKMLEQLSMEFCKE